MSSNAAVVVAAGDSKQTQHIEQTSREAKELIKNCQFRTADASAVVFQRQPEPILRWSNPTAGEVYGDIFLYTHRGRPACLASYYHWFSPDWGRTLEVHSLHGNRIVGRANEVQFWTPMSAGLTYDAIKNAEKPAISPAARLVQMRRLADEFTVQLEDTRSNAAGVKRSLRRLTQPIFRFPAPSAEADYLDGALFAFVEGTDPELLLFLDAVPAKDTSIWRFGIARLNGDHIRVTRNDQMVWEAPHLMTPYEQPRDVYTTFSVNAPLKAVP
ncbi:MAG TPA: hypothetical protein VFG20_10335 [Planctomycetaceae bacterium]|nr:hypothetical protein [Planctomycetaceae bacterium]